MRYFADFHIHSHYSRATSPEMNVVSLTKWAQIKGTNVIGTGDFTHPKWFKEMRETLEEAEPGLFKLDAKYEREIQKEVPEKCRTPMRFLLSVEISTIYKKNDRVRKVHSIVLAPSFAAAEKINAALDKVGNLKADGRPILGLDTKELLKIVLEASPECMLIPAHAWTPHFAVFGSQSGFDSLEEAFDELALHIVAIETGLSSDPLMNWQLSGLDRVALVSNSDAHSPGKLGREANVFNTDLSYFAMMDALRKNDPKAFEYTIEFFPEEGKYHLDGHRDCKVSMEPEATRKVDGKCPKCGKRLTIGVQHRVDALANRKHGYKPKGARPFKSIIPLPEVIAEVEGVGPQSKRVQRAYFEVLNKLGNEFYILIDAPISDIEAAGGSLLARAVEKMRKGEVHIEPGYDGEYGKISILDAAERASAATPQTALF